MNTLESLRQTKCEYYDYILFYLLKGCMVMLACLTILHLIEGVVHIASVRTSSARLVDVPCVLVMVLIYIIRLSNFYSFLFSLELSTHNAYALSVYLWLGFSLNNLRFNYYSDLVISQSAYVMQNSTFSSKNYCRRSLIIFVL